MCVHSLCFGQCKYAEQGEGEISLALYKYLFCAQSIKQG